MERLFNSDSPLFRLIERVMDLVLLNILFIVSCIPVITIGAAWTALSYSLLKIVKNEDSYIVRGYWKAFKLNFKQATGIWMIILIMILLLGGDLAIIGKMNGSMQIVLKFAVYVLMFVVSAVVIYIFPIIAKFENPTAAVIRNAVLISISNIIYTIAMMITIFGSGFIFLINTKIFYYGILFWALRGFAVIGWVNSIFMSKILEKYNYNEKSS